MENKEMIEEMAKEIFNTCAWRFGKPNDYKEIFNDIAEDMYNQGYRKLPKDSVVQPTIQSYSTHDNDLVAISKKEYEDLIESKRQLGCYIEDQAIWLTVLTGKDKETVNKFVKSLSNHDEFLLRAGANGALFYVDLIMWLHDVAKQLGVDLKEN